ncbi:MAG: DUF1573 domain-containing protein [Planctomycetes bacterium]|nr:DUF1573 domain-containing protein [Planctomycetota bacterium]
MIPTRALILVLLLGPALAAQESPRARVEAADLLWNFGEKEQGDHDQHRVVIHNDGKAPLTIQFAKVTCGCLSATVETPSIEPGGKGQVLIVLDASRQQGEIRKMVFIGTNDPARPRIDVNVQGLVHARARLEPELLDLGVVDPATAAPGTQTLLIREGLELELLGVDVGLPNTLEISFQPFGETKGRHGYELRVKALPGLPRGQKINVPIQFRFKDEVMPRMAGAVAVEALGLLMPSSTTIAFGSLAEGETGEVTLGLEHREGKPFKLVSLRALDPAITIEARTEIAAAKHLVKLKLSGKGRLGSLTSRFYVVTDIPEQRMLTLPITATLGKPAPPR